MSKLRAFLRGGNLLTFLTIIGVGVGLGLGFGLREATGGQWTKRNVMYLKFVGDLFLRTLSGLVLPLIFSTLVGAVGSLDISLSKKIGAKGLAYYLTTSILAAVLGTSVVHFIAPGTRSGLQDNECGSHSGGSTIDTLLDLVRNIFPSNVIAATMEHTKTTVVYNESLPFDERPFVVEVNPGTNMLGVISFALVLGVTLSYMRETAKPLLIAFDIMAKAMLNIASLLIWVGPLAAGFLIASVIVDLENISAVFTSLAWYTGVMVGTFMFHGFVVLPLIYMLLTRRLPFKFLKDMTESIITAFGTASSSATLPVTLKCLEENYEMDTRVSRFLIPIGATVNMDGAAIGVPLRVIYIAQICGMDLSFGELVSITFTSIAASIGLAGIPGVATVVSMSILASIGIPTDKIAYTIPIDWLQDRVGTVINVLGDAYGAGIVGHLSKNDLRDLPVTVTDNGDARPAQTEKFTPVIPTKTTTLAEAEFKNLS